MAEFKSDHTTTWSVDSTAGIIIITLQECTIMKDLEAILSMTIILDSP